MTLRPHASVIFKPVSDGAVLLQTESEIYFGLNRVGAELWQSLGEGATMEQLVQKLADTYPDVDSAVLEADVAELVQQLTENGLLLQDEQDGATATPSR